MYLGHNLDIRDSIADIAVVARQVLQLPPETTTSPPVDPSPEPAGPSGLVIGLVVAAVVLILMLVLLTAFVIWTRFHKTKRYNPHPHNYYKNLIIALN